MAHKTVNTDIGCNVHSCKYHAVDKENCSLPQIMVEACPGCGNGEPKDESMCASYCAK